MDAYIKELFDSVNGSQIEIEGKIHEYEEGIKLLINAFTEHKKRKSQVFFIGNGGSSAIASHMTADFMKNGGMNTYSLYDNAVTTCMGNDYGYEHIFSKPLEFLAKKEDLLVAISSSGNSENILKAIEVGRQNGMDIITFTGFKPDNKVRRQGRINIYVRSEKYGIVESAHNIMLQQIVDEIMERDGVSI